MSENKSAPYSDTRDGDASQIFEHLSSMTPEELVNEMADKWDAMNDKNFDPQIIDAYLEALNEKDPVATDYDEEASLAVFREKHSNLFKQISPVIIISGFRRWHVLRLIAVFVAIILGCMITAQALGINLFGSIAKWTEEIFQLGSSGQTAVVQKEEDTKIENNMYNSMHKVLSVYDITESVVPKQYPVGFSMGGVKVSTLPDSTKFQADYQNGIKFFTITFWEYISKEAADRTFEKDSSSVEVYERNGVKHYLMSNNGQMRAAWTNNNIACTISGDLTEDEIKDMINSIYER